MIITDIILKKMDRVDPRYPDPINRGGQPIRDVYLLTATLNDGTQQESSFPVFEDMTPKHISSMLKSFAYAIENMTAEKKAA